MTTGQPAVVVTGARGLVGQALARHHSIVPMPRGDGPIAWNPADGSVSDDGRTIAAVVHLAGASVAEGRWTPSRRQAILDSRVEGTRTIVEWLNRRAQRPSVLVCASAVGFYGDRGEEVLTESSAAGRGFLSDVCRAWEAEALRAQDAGIRVVLARFGVVLSTRGGSLAKMLPAFRVGGGGPLGSGRQWFPWVHEDDVARAILFAIRSPSLSGPMNVVAPEGVRQRDFARGLGGVLGRPALVPAPALALRAAFGRGMADELLLASQRVEPTVLQQAGFTFQHPGPGGALAHLLQS
jgi:uncharacterized protein (TIGR01777 family)